MDLPAIDLSTIGDDNARRVIVALLNLVQHQATEMERLRADNQALRDEIARLKGQPPRPSLPKGTSLPPPKPDRSSENERKTPGSGERSPRRVHVNREEVAKVDRALLPSDAIFKGYEDKLVQELLLRTDNVLYRREKFYSPSLGKTFLGPLPAGCEDGFGPQLRAWLLVLYFATNTSEPKLLELLETVGISMSSGQLSNLLTSEHARVEHELGRAYHAALTHCPWQHLDDTGTRIDGVDAFCHIVTSPLGTFFSTRLSKSRLTVLEVLRNDRVGSFRLDAQALAWMADAGVAASTHDALAPFACEQTMAEPQFVSWLGERAPWLRGETARKVWEAAALSAYHTQTDIPVVRLLISDDAKQFRNLTEEHLLCWVHRGRNLKALSPKVPLFQAEQQQVLEQFWSLYRQVRTWQQQPAPEATEDLRVAFGALATRTPAYEALGQQLQSLAAEQERLLEVVFRHPEVPLHNNPAELEARQRVRKRDVSFGPRTMQGARAWDVWQSIFSTLKQLGQNAFAFVRDRFTGEHGIARLEVLIAQRAEQLRLGGSWGLRTAPSG